MKRLSTLALTLSLALPLLGACADAPPPSAKAPEQKAQPPVPQEKAEAPRVTPDAPFRAQAPGADGKVIFSAPRVSESRLANGLRVLLVERHDLPIVSARFVVSLGAGDVPELRPGLASFMASMLEQGTYKHTALQLGDDLDALGVQRASFAEWDSIGMQMRVLSEQLFPALDLMAEITLSPTFPQPEIERTRSRRLAAIQQEKTAPPAIAQNVIAAALFGRGHAYGHSISGAEADVKGATQAEMQALYDRLFTPANAALVIAGDVTKDALLPKLESAFGTWKGKPGGYTRKPPQPPAVRAASDKRIVLVDKPGSAQSQVQLVRIGVPYAVKDREAFLVANAILGGSFSSRVNLNLREKHSYTYGARSHFNMRHGAGPFTVGGAIFTDKTGAAVKEILSELESLRKDGPTEEELSHAKEHLRLAMPARFETSTDVTSALADLVVYDLPLDDYERRSERIESVKPADVKRVAAEYFSSESMTVVVVGDKAAVSPQLDPLGLGTLDERDPFGNPLGGKAASATADKPAGAGPNDKPKKKKKPKK